jgi:hypothetical protein
MRRIWILAARVCLALSTAAALYFYHSVLPSHAEAPAPAAGAAPETPAATSLARFPEPAKLLSAYVPVGPLVVVEAKDFSGLFEEWNKSAEHSAWLQSDAYEVFSRSRVLLRLEKMQNDFAAAAGVPADGGLLSEAAGHESVLALYDIGKLELLYMTELPAARSLQSTLWQNRGRFESRSIGTQPFFVRKDPQSGRVVAFAATDHYLIVGTREDLVAGALQLAAGESSRSVEQEDWFRNVHAEAPVPGDLRMTLNMEKIAVAPLFRSYWIQQNITEMQGYSAAISDLYRSGAEYREERVLLPRPGAKTPEDSPYGDINLQGEKAVADLVANLPPDYGVYRAVANPEPRYCLEILQSKLLSPRVEEPSQEKQAPTVMLGSGETGSSSDLETPIDVAPVTDTSGEHASDALAKLIKQANPMAMLWLHSTRDNAEGPMLNVSTGVVVVGSADWDLETVRSALEQAIRPGLTASEIGVHWRQAGPAQSEYLALDGLAPFTVAARGPQLFLANDEHTMLTLLKNYSTAKRAPAQLKTAPAIYAAGFQHTRERKNFAWLSSVLKRSALAAQASSDAPADQPDFFSKTIASLSDTLENVSSESVVVRRAQNKVTQTIVYRWSE